MAILTIKSTLTFNELIKPVCIPYSSENVFDVKGFVAGNADGDFSRLKHVKISSVDIATCVFDDPSVAYLGSRNTFCVGEEGKNAKHGKNDSKINVRGRNTGIYIYF